MAEVPPGPSGALPASPAEITPFHGGGYGVYGDGNGEGHGCVRGEAATARAGQLQVCDVKATTRQNNLLSHAAAIRFNAQTQPQQLNGLICSAEDGNVNLLGHLHHPAHRPPDSGRPSEQVDSNGGARCDGLAINSGDYLHEHKPCSKKNHSYSNDNNNINGMLTMSRTDASFDQIVSGEVDSQGPHARTEPQASSDENKTEDGQGHGSKRTGVEPDTLQTPVLEMASLDLNCLPGPAEKDDAAIQYVRYESELQMPAIMRLITKDLSEPYSIYTYRYFIHNWPQLCFLAMVQSECVGAIVCKLDLHKKMFRRGYIAMLAVDSKYRRKGMGTNLVKNAIYAMVDGECDEVVLETEITNKSALKLYENLGFVRDKRLFRYYLNGVDALRLKLWLR